MKDYTAELTRQREMLTKELSSIGIHDPHNPSDWLAVPESTDRTESDSDLVADVVEEWDERQALVATLERQWNDIARALRKIETGTFGVCEICGEAVESDRLDVNPSARTCKEHMNDESTLEL